MSRIRPAENTHNAAFANSTSPARDTAPQAAPETIQQTGMSPRETHATRTGIDRSASTRARLHAQTNNAYATRAASAPVYNGSKPAPGTTDTNAARPLDPPAHGDAAHRNADTYNNVINQFAVGNNPRYAQRNGNTYCNIFVWDVTRAMNAEVPHWVDRQGNPMPYGRGNEMDANATNSWLREHGTAHGWHKVTAEQAQKLANEGFPAIASWNNPRGIGHIAIVRPGQINNNGPEIAQAGSVNSNDTHVGNTFGKRAVEYFVNDSGRSAPGAQQPSPESPAPPKTPPTQTSPNPPASHAPSTRPAAPHNSHAAARIPASDLQRGNHNGQVRQLQTALVDLGYLKQSDMNTGPGTFGPHTFAAVRQFQSEHNVPNTGYYGPLTRAALSRTLNTAPPNNLQRGQRGPEVRQLQAEMVRLGCMKQSDMNTGPGIFGPLTFAAVQKFQRTHNVPATGFYGPLTRNALTRALSDAPPPQATNPSAPKPSAPKPSAPKPAPAQPAPTRPPATSPGTTTTAPSAPQGGKSVADPTGILSGLHPKGASATTAKAEGLPGGFQSSQTIAARDRTRVLESHDLKHKFEQIGKEYGIPPALLAGIASRETHGGSILASDGTGDFHHGYGVMQVDNQKGTRKWETAGGPYGTAHIRQAAGIFKSTLDKVKRDFPNMSPEHQLETAVSRYNGGHGLPYPRSDEGTTGQDYANDTLARAQYFAAHWDK